MKNNILAVALASALGLTAMAQKAGTAWINLFARAPYPAMGSTPDNFDFTQFDFNGLYAFTSSVTNF